VRWAPARPRAPGSTTQVFDPVDGAAAERVKAIIAANL
jgi:hypothetical protein